MKVVERKPIDQIDDMTLVLADQSQKAIAQVTALAQELLSGKMPPEKAKEVAHRLASGIWTHDFPITVETAKELIGLPISTEIPGEVFLVTTLYPQAQQDSPQSFISPDRGIREENLRARKPQYVKSRPRFFCETGCQRLSRFAPCPYCTTR